MKNELDRLTKTGHLERLEKQIGQDSSRRPKTKVELYEKEATFAKQGRTIKSNLRQTIEKRPRRDLNIGDLSRLRSDVTGTENQQTLQLCKNKRENQRILLLLKGILQTR